MFGRLSFEVVVVLVDLPGGPQDEQFELLDFDPRIGDLLLEFGVGLEIPRHGGLRSSRQLKQAD